jgi:glycerophosphoryl diester phosphodiesterase
LRVIIEIKNGPVYYDGIEAKVAEAVRASGHSKITVSSFDHAALKRLQAIAPDIETATLYMGRLENPVRMAQEAGARVLHPYWMWVTPELIEMAHAAGLRVEAWTVDVPVQPLFLPTLRMLDGVITNQPAQMRTLLEGECASEG